MSKKYSQQPQDGNNSQLDKDFKHNTSIGADGTILYDAPIEIKDQSICGPLWTLSILADMPASDA